MMSSPEQAIEAVYPLSSAQEGILFHSSLSPDEGIYLTQRLCTLPSDLDVELFKDAWRQVIQRHTILRTAFLFGTVEKSLQVVGRRAQLSWAEEDWRQQPPDAEPELLNTMLKADRMRGFELTRAPLMRFRLVCRHDGSYYLLWSFHHAILDGWSYPLVLKEVDALYTAARQGRKAQLPAAQPYQSYIAWLQQQDLGKAERFWKGYLQGVVGPTPFGKPWKEAQGSAEYERYQLQLEPSLADALETLLQRYHLTMNTVVLGAWALLLSRYSGETDVIFGTAVSGRPPTLPGIEGMVGMFINTLPVRVRIAEGQPTLSWLRELQQQQAEMRQYEYTPLVQVQKWSEIPRESTLFEHILVCSAGGGAASRDDSSLKMEAVDFIEITNYPLEINIEAGSPFILQATYETHRFDEDTIRHMFLRLQAILQQMSAHPEQQPGSIDILSDAERRQLLVKWNQTEQAGLPLMPNGKVDRRALPDLIEQGSYAEPRSEIERQLVQIWRQVLHAERVGIHDSFFALGGDSILAVRVVARARQAGVHLGVRDLFQHPTIAELGPTLSSASAETLVTQQKVSEAVPLTPVQHWFFERRLPAAHHWNQSFLFSVKEPLDPALLRASLHSWQETHDALRLRFYLEGNEWKQACVAVEQELPLSVFVRPETLEKDGDAWMRERIVSLEASLNLEKGPLWRVALFDAGQDQPQYLLFVVHHLAVDVTSWHILLHDWQRIYHQLQAGTAVQLSPVPTSFALWARRLEAYARSLRLMRERTYWLGRPWNQVKPIPRDMVHGENTERHTRALSVMLDKQETHALLYEVSRVYHMLVHEVLLAALTETYAHWTQERTLLVDLEGHGREDIIEDVDLSRTVGWFTTLVPLCLDIRQQSKAEEVLIQIKEQIRAVPHGGIAYGLLRYMSQNQQVRQQLAALPQSEIVFNYRGRSASMLEDNALLVPANDVSGFALHPDSPRTHLLAFDGQVIDDQLRITVSYSEQCYRLTTIEQLLEWYREALLAIIMHCQAQQEEHFTPQDFPEADLDQSELDSILASVYHEMES